MESRSNNLSPFWTFALTVLMTLLSATSTAGDLRVIQCSTCTVVDDFRASAVASAISKTFPGTYVVTNPDVPLTGIVKIVGTRRQLCDSNGECWWRLQILDTAVIDEDGQPADQEALARIDDALYVVSRKTLVGNVVLPADAPAFEGGYEELLSSPIQAQLIAMNPAFNLLEKNTVVTVVFPNGTKATFRKICVLCSIPWSWTGNAWDSQGRRIDRNGNLIASGPGSGGADGVVDVSSQGRNYRLTAQPMCTFGTQVHDPAGGMTYTVARYIPC